MSHFLAPVTAKLFSATETAPTGETEENKTFVSLNQRLWAGHAAPGFQGPALNSLRSSPAAWQPRGWQQESLSLFSHFPGAYRWGWVCALELKRFPMSIFFSRSVDLLGPAPSSGLVWLSETTTFPRLIEDNKREKHKAHAGCVDGALGAYWELAAGIKRYKVYFYLCFLICLLCNSISIYLSQSVPISALRSVRICAPSHLW